eukprot:gene19460-biopygen20530
MANGARQASWALRAAAIAISRHINSNRLSASTLGEGDCASGLECFQRAQGGPLPPGCTGRPVGAMDYCFIPTTSPTAAFGTCPFCQPHCLTGSPVEISQRPGVH